MRLTARSIRVDACWRVNDQHAFSWPHALARASVLFYLVLLPFSHNAALKYLGLFFMLCSMSYLAWKKQLLINWQLPSRPSRPSRLMVMSFLGLLAVLVLSSLFGREPLDSLNELRKHFLPGMLLFILIVSCFTTERFVMRLCLVLVLAFAARTGLTLLEIGQYFPNIDLARNEGNFVKGYSMSSTLYLPFIIGLLALHTLGRTYTALLVLLTLSSFVSLFLLQSRTPLIAALLLSVTILLLLQRYKLLLATAGVILLAAASVLLIQPQMADRFASVFERSSYTGEQGLSLRASIWQGSLEIIQEHPYLGYGFGWKKLGTTARNDGHLARWQAQTEDAYARIKADYFALPTAKVNPHNLYIQLLFESGLFGLLAYLLCMACAAYAALKALRKDHPPIQKMIGAAVLGYLAGHLILGLADGLLIGQGPSFALLALLVACNLHAFKPTVDTPN